MGVHTLIDRKKNQAAMFCSTTDWAFGPVFSDSDDHDAADRVDSFLRWLKVDPRKFSDTDLEGQYCMWRSQEDAQWDAETRAKEQELREDEKSSPERRKAGTPCPVCGAGLIAGGQCAFIHGAAEKKAWEDELDYKPWGANYDNPSGEK